MTTGSIGVVLLVVAGSLLAHRRTLPVAFGATADPGAGTSSSPAPPRSGAAGSGSAAPAPAPTVVTDPTSVHLDAFGVTAPVVAVTSAAGRLEPPDDPARVGWWIASAPPGAAAGTTVLIGHVDGPAGPGAFYRLTHARPGDPVSVAGSNGQSVRFRVSRLQYVAKTTGLAADLFTQTGPPRLVIISCGGSFDRTTDEYADNVVVTALPG